MSVRDGELHLAAAIDSILGQSVAPHEVIVVDDGSQDGSPTVLTSFGDALKVLRQAPKGVSVALNHAIAATTGDLLAFLDADDLWPPHSLDARLRRLDEADAPAGVYGHTTQFISPELPADEARRLRVDTTPGPAPILGALLVRRELFDRVGPFDESLRSAAGVDWVLRARDEPNPLAAIDEVVLQRRIHASNTGRTLHRETTLAALRTVVRSHHERRHR